MTQALKSCLTKDIQKPETTSFSSILLGLVSPKLTYPFMSQIFFITEKYTELIFKITD